MSPEDTEKESESEAETAQQSLMEMLSSLKKEEILEVLSDGFCPHCEDLILARIRRFHKRKLNESSYPNEGTKYSREVSHMHRNRNGYASESFNGRPAKQWNRDGPWNSSHKHEPIFQTKRNRHEPRSLDHSHRRFQKSDFDLLLNDGIAGDSSVETRLSDEEKEHIRFSLVQRKKDYIHIERVRGRVTNVLRGLELHTRVFNIEEQKKIVDYCYKLQRMGRNGQLRERTYSEPRKWMRGKGRVTIQFGCCYNYAEDKDGNPPGIIRHEEVDPLPSLFKQIIKRIVRWHILPSTCVPDSCIVNIYEEGDCIPPHIDHHDFVRPFCTVSFLSECDILFGSTLKVVSPGEFSGPVSIPLPVGSVLIFNGNGADVAKHCIPAVLEKRISITFRKMDDSKLPYKFSPDPELAGIKPLNHSPVNKSGIRRDEFGNSGTKQQKHQSNESNSGRKSTRYDLSPEEDEIPRLNGSFSKLKVNQNGRRR